MDTDYDTGFVSGLVDRDRTGEYKLEEGRLESQFYRSLSLVEETHPFPIPPKPYYDYDGDFRWQYGGEEKEKEYGVAYKHYETLYNYEYPKRI